MPFESLDDIETRDAYISLLKEELVALRNSGDASDFYFLEKFRFDGKTADPIFVVGRVTSKFLSQLKQLPGDVAHGHCVVKGKDLRLIPKRGRTSKPKLKTALRGTQFRPDLLADQSGIAEEEEQAQRLETERMLEKAQDQYKKVQKHIPPAERRKLKVMFGKYEKIFKEKDFDGAQKQLSEMGDRMAKLLKYAMLENRAMLRKREREQKQIHKSLGEVSAAVNKLDKLAKDQKAQVERLRDGVAKVSPSRKTAEAILGVRDRLAEHEKTLKQIRAQIVKAKRRLSDDFSKLKSKKMQDPASMALATMVTSQGGRINALEKVLDQTPLDDAKSKLAKAIKALKESVE